MQTTVNNLKWRIYNVFPANQLGLDQLLSLLDIRYDERIPTAQISVSFPPLLKFNPKFVENYCKTDEHLLMILMHEMYHILLGHTKMFPKVTPATNFACDAVINAMLCQSLPAEEYTSFFKSFYPTDGIAALLRPPDNWDKDEPHNADWSLDGDLLYAHKALYTQDGEITYKDIYDLISEKVNQKIDVLLLGNHDSEEKKLNEILQNAIVNIVGKWPAIIYSEGRDNGMLSVEEMLDKLKPKKDVTRMIKRAINRITSIGSGNLTMANLKKQTTLLPYPTLPDRRASVIKHFGVSPLFYKGEVMKINKQRVGYIHVYLDVSGSMNDYLETIFGSLKSVMNVLYPKIHVFSTEVHEHTPKEILSGTYSTTGGTDINCAVEHIMKNKIKKAIIITDGYVGELDEKYQQKIKEFKPLISKLLTEPHYSKEIDVLNGRTYKLSI